MNLTLNEDLVSKARRLTDNLSAVVESLLAEFLAQDRDRRATQLEQARQAAASWNKFASKAGSFADEHSTL